MFYTVPLQISGRWWPLEDLPVQGKHFSKEKYLGSLFESTFNPDQDLGPVSFFFFLFLIKSYEVFDRALQVKELSEKLSVRVNAF